MVLNSGNGQHGYRGLLQVAIFVKTPLMLCPFTSGVHGVYVWRILDIFSFRINSYQSDFQGRVIRWKWFRSLIIRLTGILDLWMGDHADPSTSVTFWIASI